jgi:Na+:H+ antiporter, NhaA family
MTRPPTRTLARPLPRILLAVARPFRRFLQTEAAGGMILLAATALALGWANSPWADVYEGLVELPMTLSIGQSTVSWPLHHFINDALMSVFFLVVGMEIKRELLVGELRTLRRALLPALAALGGMVVPALIHFSLNRGTPAQPGWGVPVATDIAFALGCLALVSRRVPSSLAVFLMALAIFDDLGAIVVIALFYGQSVHTGALLAAAGITAVLVAMTRARVVAVWPYVVVGIALWIAVARSGIHPTIAGVVIGVCIPSRAAKTPSEVLADVERAVHKLRRHNDRELDASGPLAALERHLEAMQPPLDRMVHGLHGWVAFAIVPLFAIANAGIHLSRDLSAVALSPASLGVLLGLFVGKPVGVFGATWLAVRSGIAPRPTGASWWQILGVSILAGIGFTMSIFIATLAFGGDVELADASKVGIMAGSLASALVGLALLRRAGQPRPTDAIDDLEVIDLLPQFADGFRVEAWAPHGDLLGKTLAEAALPAEHGITVLGIRRPSAAGGLLPAQADYVLDPHDTLLLVGERDRVATFLARPR